MRQEVTESNLNLVADQLAHTEIPPEAKAEAPYPLTATGEDEKAAQSRQVPRIETWPEHYLDLLRSGHRL